MSIFLSNIINYKGFIDLNFPSVLRRKPISHTSLRFIFYKIMLRSSQSGNARLSFVAYFNKRYSLMNFIVIYEYT